MENKIQEGIPLIKEWIERKRTEFENNDNFKELIRVINEIEQDKDYSKDAYEDIRYLLRPFEYIPLKIKRLLNIGTLDNYTIFIASRHFESIDDFINLELSTSKFNGNMTKFFYNPISLTKKIRNFFPNIQTLYLYSLHDDEFINDKKIFVRERHYETEYGLTKKQVQQLEEWTKLKCGDVLFDSTIDKWSENTSILNERILGKKQITFLKAHR